MNYDGQKNASRHSETSTSLLDRTTVDHDPRFTSTDYVRGNVVLALERADAVSRITVELSGNLFSSVVAAATNPWDGTAHATNSHKLFDILVCQLVFPPPNLSILSKGFSLPEGTSTFPFVFRFPLISTCSDTNHDWIKRLNTSLPPSIKVHAPHYVASAEAKYTLKVKVERPGRFKSDVNTQLELNFMPLGPTLPPPMLNPVSSRTSRSLLWTLSETMVTVGPNTTSSWKIGGWSLKDVVVPDVKPSFTACILIQQHFLVVSEGFLYGIDGSIELRQPSILMYIRAENPT
ncbi:hypothetical protein WAI453_011653 [Rhynchosporium graminicola]